MRPQANHSSETAPVIPQRERAALLKAIDFIRTTLVPAERNIRSIPEHVTWVKGEVREFLEAADDPEHRREELGDVIMVLLRLSCFRYPEKTSEEILAIYEMHPSFLRYVRQLGAEGLEAMGQKFFSRYSFLSDPEVCKTLFVENGGQHVWQEEIMRRMFAAEKSKEPGRPFQKPDVALFKAAFDTPRLDDDRFFRMVALDFAATRDAIGTIGRILTLVGTREEVEAFLREGAGIRDGIFIRRFAGLLDEGERASLPYFREYWETYRFCREQGFGRESFDMARDIVGTWQIFQRAGGAHDFLPYLEALRKDPKIAEETNADSKYVMIIAAIHRMRKKSGVYEAADKAHWNFLRLVKPYADFTGSGLPGPARRR
jgi:hypothetical protein